MKDDTVRFIDGRGKAVTWTMLYTTACKSYNKLRRSQRNESPDMAQARRVAELTAIARGQKQQ